MVIKLPGFGKRKEDDSYYGSYYPEGFETKEDIDVKEAPDPVGNIDIDADMKEMPREEQQNHFGGINEAAVSLKVMAPKNYAEATKVADSLIAGSTVVLNVEALEKAELIRFMDFLMGVLYVIRGNMKKVSNTTVVVSPSGIADDSETKSE